VVITGTLWPDLHIAYAAVPVRGSADPRARERELLDLAAVVRIDPEFSPAEQDLARRCGPRSVVRIALPVAGSAPHPAPQAASGLRPGTGHLQQAGAACAVSDPARRDSPP
jgi:hypothetical protein